jgi:hypothetical protein
LTKITLDSFLQTPAQSYFERKPFAQREREREREREKDREKERERERHIRLTGRVIELDR